MRRFRSFRLDPVNQCLWQGKQRASLTPKGFDVLRYFVEHPNRLITQDEVLEALWPETHVNPELVKKYIREIRKVLGDRPDEPEFIETIPRRGYQFIAPVSDDAADRLADLSSHAPKKIVGRAAAVAELDRCLGKARQSQRQVVFVTGEAGIGKTTAVDVFVRQSAENIRIARGQCVEGFGGKEPFYPVLEAIGQLIRSADATLVIEVLTKQAPTWLIQFPSLVNPQEVESLQRDNLGTTRERMLREICEAVETLTSHFPLLLILEDLHWVDPSTLDVISALARRRQPVRLMLIATYRPADVVLSQSPLKGLKRDLIVHNLCTDVPLERLEESDIAEFLASEFAGLSRGFSGLVYRHSGGNALFMTAILQDLQKRGVIARDKNGWILTKPLEETAITVPETLQGMLEEQFEQLSPTERDILESASVAGERFSVWALAHMLDISPRTIEDVCEGLSARQQFIKSAGFEELGSLSETACYEFRHALYRQAVYGAISELARSRLHRRLAHGLVELGAASGKLASELALHFERGRDYRQAARYLQKAADNANRRFAYDEAIGLARHGLELLLKIPDTPERVEQELRLQLTLGMSLIATQGFAAPDVGDAYMRARKLCQQSTETPGTSEVLWGLWTFHTLRAEFGSGHELAQELLRLGERLGQPDIAMRGHWASEITFTHLGEFALALKHYDKALSLYDPARHINDGLNYALNPGVAMPCFASWALWFLGDTDQALHRIQEALTCARSLSEPLGLAHAFFFAAALYQLRREAQTAQEHAEEAIAISTQHGLTMYQAMATVVRGWAVVKQGGDKEVLKEMGGGLATLQSRDTHLLRPYFVALLVESFDKARRAEEGLQMLDEALAMISANGERYYEAELYRLKGEIVLSCCSARGASVGGSRGVSADPVRVEDSRYCFGEAMKIAQRQNAKSLELRAALNLAYLHRQQGGRQEAKNLITEVYSKFAEGLDSADLHEAKALLREL